MSILPERIVIRKFLWLALPDEFFFYIFFVTPTEAFCEWLKSPSTEFSTELTQNSNILVTS